MMVLRLIRSDGTSVGFRLILRTALGWDFSLPVALVLVYALPPAGMGSP